MKSILVTNIEWEKPAAQKMSIYRLYNIIAECVCDFLFQGCPCKPIENMMVQGLKK